MHKLGISMVPTFGDGKCVWRAAALALGSTPAASMMAGSGFAKMALRSFRHAARKHAAACGYLAAAGR